MLRFNKTEHTQSELDPQDSQDLHSVHPRSTSLGSQPEGTSRSWPEVQELLGSCWVMAFGLNGFESVFALFEFLNVFVRAIQKRDDVVDHDTVECRENWHPEEICTHPSLIQIP